MYVFFKSLKKGEKGQKGEESLFKEIMAENFTNLG